MASPKKNVGSEGKYDTQEKNLSAVLADTVLTIAGPGITI